MGITLNTGTGGSELKTYTVSTEEIQAVSLNTPLGDSVFDDTNDAIKVVNDTASLFQVTVGAALPAGTNAIGKLASNSGVDIGDVSINNTSIPIAGVAAEDAAVSGNPVLSAGRYDLADRSLDDGDVGALALDSKGHIITTTNNFASTVNSTTTPLGIGGVFTGTGEDISKYAAINIQILTDESSAAGGLSLQWSTDNTNWDHAQAHTVTANESFMLQAMGEGNYFRIVYTNGGTGQTSFRLKVIYKAVPSVGEVQHLDELVLDGSDAQLVRSVLAGRNPGGTYANIGITTGGNLKIAVEEFDTSLPAGTNAIGKLSANSGVDIGDVDVLSLIPGTGATSLGKAEDAAHTTGDTGVMGLSVRQDSAASTAGSDGDYQPLITDANGRLHVIDVSTLAALSGSEFQVDVVAALPAGTNAIGKLASNSGVDIGDVDILSLIPGVGATNLGKAEDAVHSSGDVGVMSLAVRNDTLAALAGADGDYAPIQVDDRGSIYVSIPNKISTVNSSTATLGIGATFTGTGEDVSNCGSITVTVDASHDSSASGMTMQFSTDNSNWDDVYTWTYTAADGSRRFQYPVTAQYFRVVYTNGGTGQSHFRCQTILHSEPVSSSVHRIEDNVDPDRSSTLVKSVVIAQAAGSGDFVPVQATGGGNFKVAVEEFDTSLPAGTNAIGKLSANSGVDIGDVDVTSVIAGTGATNLGKAQDTAVGATDTGVALLFKRDDEQSAVTPIDGDYVVPTCDKFGKVKTTELPDATSEIKYGVINASSSGDNTLQAAAGAGIKIRVLSMFAVSAGTVSVRVESGAAGAAMTGQMPLVANSGFVLPDNPRGWFETADNALLNLELSAAIAVHGSFSYVEV